MRRRRGRRRRRRRCRPWRRRWRWSGMRRRSSLRRRWGRRRRARRRGRRRWWGRSRMRWCGRRRRWSCVRRGCRRRRPLRRLLRFRFAVRADFARGSGRLRHDQRRCLRVGNGARNRHRRNGRRGKQHKTKFHHDECGSRIVRRAAQERTSVRPDCGGVQMQIRFISDVIIRGSAGIHGTFRPARNPE